MDQYIRDYNHKPLNTIEIDSISDFNKTVHILEENNEFMVFHQNIRSIYKNLDELKIMLSQLTCRFDCIVLTETFRIFDCKLFQITGYEMIYNEGIINKNDAVAVFIKKNINYSTKIVFIDECKAIQIKINLKNKKYLLITSIYRPPSTNAENFIINLKNYLEQTKNTLAEYHAIVGDINLNISDENQITSNYLNTLCEYNYISAINKNTRIQGVSSSCIDHIFVKSKIQDLQNNCASIILDTQITDHKATILGLSISTKKDENLKLESNYINYINYENLKQDLRTHDWNIYFNIDDVNMLATYMIKILNDITAKHTKVIKRKRNDIKRKQWITNGLIKSINTKNELHRKYKNNPDNHAAKEEFITYRNYVNKLIKTTKSNFYKKQINLNKNNSKNLWSVVKSISSSTKKQNITEILTDDDKIIQGDQMLANAFNEFYSNVGEKYAKKIVKPMAPFPKRNLAQGSIYLEPINTHEVVSIIKSLKSKKAPGIDMIKAETLKKVADEIAEPLTYLINKIFESGKCPAEFKMAVITPIYKKGEKTKIINYRPISLITNLTKIFEKALKAKLTKYIDKYNLVSNSQFGFREGKSTNDAIYALTNDIYKFMDESKPGLCIFLDLAKAFDTVSHPLLLEALEDIGVRGIAHSLLADYLHNRKQFVKIGSSISSQRIISYGVPQGTVLGPLLFSIYINNLLTLDTCGKITSFADDTVILYTADTWAALKNKVENDFCHIIDWFNHMLLTINFEKTFFMPFTSYKNNLPEFQYLTINNHNNNINIKTTNQIKYLGVTIDSHLRWDIHVNNVTQTLRGVLYKFKYLKNLLDTTHMKIIYYALVESRIQYAILSWGGVLYSHLNKLDILQKKCLKIMYNKENTYPSDSLFAEARVLDVRQIFMYNILIYLYKDKKNLQKIDHMYETRHKTKDNVQFTTTKKSIGQRCYAYLSRRIFNSLPDMYKTYIHVLNHIGLVKKILKNYILNLNREGVHTLIEN